MKTTLKKMKNEDDLKKKKISIPLKFRGKPFLGLAQLSKIFLYLNYIPIRTKQVVRILKLKEWFNNEFKLFIISDGE